MKKYIFILSILFIPTFSLMLRPGIYTMHDFHVFRQFEFNKCVESFTFPCRWAPDSEMGYGEPLFNFYTQLPYWIGEIFHLSGFSIIASVKITFILSLVASGISMYLLARTFWGDLGGTVSAILYVYAPYRSVDVWVRGALPEALAFVFYPLVLLGLHRYCKSGKYSYLLLFTLSLAALITTHNLSLIMFMPLLGAYWIYYSVSKKTLRHFRGLILSTLLALGLSAYYLLPVALESKYIDLNRAVQGYYDFHIHFATLRELFITRFWGYGGSLWMKKFLSVSIGQVQWIVPLISIILLIKRRPASTFSFLAFSSLGLLALFFTHGKSAPVWNFLPFMKYIQFPWRYLTSAIFFVALAGGFCVQQFSNRWAKAVGLLIMISAIGLNFSFFRPDIWQNVNDQQFFSGASWDFNRTAHKDYWPKTGGLPPTQIAPTDPQLTQRAHSATYQVEVTDENSVVQIPIVYFPGWKAQEGNQNISLTPQGRLGLITINLPKGKHILNLTFTNTWPRTTGNLISGLSLGILVLWYLKMRGLRSY